MPTALRLLLILLVSAAPLLEGCRTRAQPQIAEALWKTLQAPESQRTIQTTHIVSEAHGEREARVLVNTTLERTLSPGEPLPKRWPEGSTVVMDLFDSYATPEYARIPSYTVRIMTVAMEKRADGWFFAEWSVGLDGTPTLEVSGGGKQAPKACVKCHAQGHDFLFSIRPPS